MTVSQLTLVDRHGEQLERADLAGGVGLQQPFLLLYRPKIHHS